jgi:hypothetical protein
MEELKYGNISRELLSKLYEENIFTNYIGEFSFSDYPNYYNSSEEVIGIIKTQEEAQKAPNWDAIIGFCKLWDADFFGGLKQGLDRLKIPYDDDYIRFLYNIAEDISALIVQLKNNYQRPRPYQLAYYTSQNLHPFESKSANTPSYPSGHAIQAYFLCSIISFHYDEQKDNLMKLAKQVADSRVILGVHYPSDNVFGIEIVKQLMLKNDIKQKYFPNV